MREFDLSDILTVTTGKLVSTRHIDGVYDILNYMTGENLFTHQLPRASDECKPRLVRQYPHLSEESLKEELTILSLLLKDCFDETSRKQVVNDWLKELKGRFGETLPVEPLGTSVFINPIIELDQMINKMPNKEEKQVIVVVAPNVATVDLDSATPEEIANQIDKMIRDSK
jgi:hypothetical protein